MVWATQTTLTLSTDQAIEFRAPVKVNGGGRVVLSAGQAGGFGPYVTYYPGGALTFLHHAGSLRINNADFTLVPSIQSLAHAIKLNPGGNYALSNDYNARADGAYKVSPIQTTLTGIFDGLGHTIAKLKIKDQGLNVGLFTTTDGSASIRNINLTDVSVAGRAKARRSAA